MTAPVDAALTGATHVLEWESSPLVPNGDAGEWVLYDAADYACGVPQVDPRWLFHEMRDTGPDVLEGLVTAALGQRVVMREISPGRFAVTTYDLAVNVLKWRDSSYIPGWGWWELLTADEEAAGATQEDDEFTLDLNRHATTGALVQAVSAKTGFAAVLTPASPGRYEVWTAGLPATCREFDGQAVA